MRLRRIQLLLVACLAAAGCSLSDPTFYPIGSLASFDSSLNSTVRTTQTSNILHRQKIRLAGYAKLDAPITVAEHGPYRRSVALTPDDLLYGGTWMDGDKVQIAYCSFKRTARSYILMSNDGFDLPTCLRGPSRSGTFTHYALNYSTGSLTEKRDMPFASGLLAGVEALPSPVAYHEVTAVPDAQQVELGIRFNDKATPASLEVIYFSDGEQKQLEDSITPLPASRQAPYVLDVRGARIEIVDLAGGVLSYRVLSGFRSDIPTLLDLRAPATTTANAN